jgi:hypothetical protein
MPACPPLTVAIGVPRLTSAQRRTTACYVYLSFASTMNAEYWEKKTALIRNGAVRVIALSGSAEVDYWRDRLRLTRGNARKIELMTWARHATTLRGRTHYDCIGEVVEYIFRFIRSSEGELLKFGLVAFSKPEDRALARHVIDIFEASN